MKQHNYFTAQNTNGCRSVEQLTLMNAAFDAEIDGYDEDGQYFDLIGKYIADIITIKQGIYLNSDRSETI